MAPPHSRCRRSGPALRITRSRPWSRGRIDSGNRGRPAPRPVADAARELGLPVLTPPKIGAPEVVAELLALEPDCLVVAAYGQILPSTLIDPPTYGAVNVHASLLPRWRGASPIAHAILAGDAETGVSIMRMEAGLDTGPVYAMARVADRRRGDDTRADRDARRPRRRGAALRARRARAGRRGRAHRSRRRA